MEDRKTKPESMKRKDENVVHVVREVPFDIESGMFVFSAGYLFCFAWGFLVCPRGKRFAGANICVDRTLPGLFAAALLTSYYGPRYRRFLDRIRQHKEKDQSPKH